jgi:formylmethanofuran dehydrogenase subunit E
MISLKKAAEFHGHLGPYLVLGLLSGGLAVRKLKAKKYFGLKIKAWGATQKPKSCLIDGLQLSTGATYGKGNIEKAKGKKIVILFSNLKNKKNIEVSLKEEFVRKLDSLKGHRDCEEFAKVLYRMDPAKIFNLTLQHGS